MTNKLLFLLLFNFVLNPSFSQVKNFGSFSQKDWEVKKCSFDSTAKALILFDYGNVTIQIKSDHKNREEDCPLKLEFYEMTFSRNLRIKILDTFGLKTNKLTFKLKTKNNLTDKLSMFKGTTSWMENGKKNKVKFNSTILIKEKDDDGNYIMTCGFPNIKAGCIIEIEYIIVSNNFDELPEWNFENEIPAIYSEFGFSIPDFLVYQSDYEIFDLLTSDGFSEQTSHEVYFSTTDGNYLIKKYEYNNEKKSYKLMNIKGSPNSDTKGQLRHTLKSNNIQTVFGKKESINLYKK